MTIKILGTGCPSCKKLEANTREAIKQLNRNDEVVKITDISEIMSYGIMSLPALIAGGKVLSFGTISTVEAIKDMLNKNA
jgi:small redox-active disulfide protein 2